MPGGNGRHVPGGGVPASRRFLVLALPTAHVSQRAVPAARRLGRNAGRATGARSRCAATWVAGGRFAGVLRGRSGGPGEGTWDGEAFPDVIYFGVLAKLGARRRMAHGLVRVAGRKVLWGRGSAASVVAGRSRRRASRFGK